MFPAQAWDSTPTLGWEIAPFGACEVNFPQFSGIGTFLD
jgi:hypothetical protein